MKISISIAFDKSFLNNFINLFYYLSNKKHLKMSGDDINLLYEYLGYLFCKRQEGGNYPIIAASKAVEVLLGYSTQEFLKIKRFVKLIHPADLIHFNNNIKESSRQKKPYVFEYRLLHKNGHYILIQEKGRIVAHGKTTYIEGILQLASSPTVHQKDHVDPLFNIASEGILVHKNNIIQIANEAFYKIFDQESSEVIGQDILSKTEQIDHDLQIESILSKLKSEKRINYQQVLWFIKKNAQKTFVSISTKPILYLGEMMQSVLFKDITHEIEIQVELENSKEKYRAFANSSQEGIVMQERGVIIDVNQKLCDIIGYKKTNLIGKELSLFVPPEEIPKVIQSLLENDQNHTKERQDSVKILHKSGKIITVAIWANGVELNGKALRYVVVRDISDEVKAKEELIQSQQKYKRLSDITEEMILVHDNGIIVEVNKASCNFYGYTEKELIGMHTFDLTPKKIIQEYGLTKKILEEAYKSDQVTEGIHEKEKEGTKLYCQYKESILYVGGRRLRYVVMRNITDIQIAHQQLEESRNKYKIFADASQEAISIHKFGVLKEVNQAYKDLFKITEEDIEGLDAIRFIKSEHQQVTKVLMESYRQIASQIDISKLEDLTTFQGIFRAKLRQLIQDQQIQLPFDRNAKGAVILPLVKYDGTAFIGESVEDFILIDNELYQFQIIRDITDVVNAQKQLEDSRNKYKLIADATNEAIVLQTVKGIIKEVNQTYCNLFVTNPEYIIGKTGMEFVPSEELESVFKLLWQNQDYLSKENYTEFPPITSTLTLQKSNGERFVAETQASYTVINDELLRYTVIRDMTKIVHAQRLLQESNAKYKRLSDATKEGVIIHKDGIISEVNQTACKLFGWEEENLIGRHIQELTNNVNINIINSLQDENTGKIDRILLQKLNGDTFIAEIWESTIIVEGESLRYTVVRDMTERIHYEQRIEELVDDLSEKNKQLNCLFDLARISSNKSYSLDELLEETLLLIPKSWQYPDICEVSLSYGQKEWSSPNYQKALNYISAPIICNNKEAGQVKVAYIEDCPTADEGPFLLSERALIDALGIQLGTLIEKRLSEDLVVASILETEDRERTRIAKELHDSLGQLLMAISLNMEALKKDIHILSEKSQLKFSNALSYLGQAIQESRQIAHNLMPKAISDYGYVLAVESMLEGIQFIENINFHFYDNLEGERLNGKMELALFRITQEATTNALKHAQAENITIQLMKYSDVLILTIEDDGMGFDINRTKEQFGLNSIKNRTNSISGILSIESRENYGTTIMIEVPL